MQAWSRVRAKLAAAAVLAGSAFAGSAGAQPVYLPPQEVIHTAWVDFWGKCGAQQGAIIVRVRGSASHEVRIVLGQGQHIALILPTDSTYSWSCGAFNDRARFIPVKPRQ